MHTVDEKDFMLLQRIGAAKQQLEEAQTFLHVHKANEPEIVGVAVCVNSALQLLKDGGQIGSTEEAL